MNKSMRKRACAKIRHLVKYALNRNLIEPSDSVYAINRLLAIMGISEYEAGETNKDTPSTPTSILEELLNIAAESGVLNPDTTATREIFETELMSALTPRPSFVIAEFEKRYAVSPHEATDWFYKFSHDTDYIKKDRIDRNINWVYSSRYGDIHITINLAKPEKDPKDIMLALEQEENQYPTCVLCLENEGYRGSPSSPARGTHRIIPIDIDGEQWYFQYSPYVYYNEHCIALSRDHVPMRIQKATFGKLFAFLELFPHYFIGSNAGLPIVGGSILSHEHFQGGRFTFPIECAREIILDSLEGFEDVSISAVEWPMTTLRLRSSSKEELIALSEGILEFWEGYSDEKADIIASSGEVPHNTITPIARIKGGLFELDLVLRNNRTDKENPYGIFHPATKRHHIKKENIGLIEVMGLAVLPPRLKSAMGKIAHCLEEEPQAFYEDNALSLHTEWYEELVAKFNAKTMDAKDFLRDEIGEIFVLCLEDAGVFKHDAVGELAFKRFLNALYRKEKETV